MTNKDKACGRCGYIGSLEKHHKKHRVDGGSDAFPNRWWLCQDCHDYQHAKDAVLKAIKAEKKRLEILETRLVIIEEENAPEKMRSKGYQAYWELNHRQLTPQTKCGKHIGEAIQ